MERDPMKMPWNYLAEAKGLEHKANNLQKENEQLREIIKQLEERYDFKLIDGRIFDR